MCHLRLIFGSSPVLLEQKRSGIGQYPARGICHALCEVIEREPRESSGHVPKSAGPPSRQSGRIRISTGAECRSEARRPAADLVSGTARPAAALVGKLQPEGRARGPTRNLNLTTAFPQSILHHNDQQGCQHECAWRMRELITMRASRSPAVDRRPAQTRLGTYRVQGGSAGILLPAEGKPQRRHGSLERYHQLRRHCVIISIRP